MTQDSSAVVRTQQRLFCATVFVAFMLRLFLHLATGHKMFYWPCPLSVPAETWEGMGQHVQHSYVVWWRWSPTSWRVEVRLAARVVRSAEGVGREWTREAIRQLASEYQATEVREER
jgi:hypothetical protein